MTRCIYGTWCFALKDYRALKTVGIRKSIYELRRRIDGDYLGMLAPH